MRKRKNLGNCVVSGQIYTPEQLAALLQVGKQTIYNKLSRGEKLHRCFRVGNRVRFMGSDVVKFIREQQP